MEHLCGDVWRPGSVGECTRHGMVRVRPPTTPFSERSHVTVEGVASTGQVSPKGTVAHREWFDGHVDATASVRPVTAKLADLRRQHGRQDG
jgi:hypothetical protein